jgi:hypothetical protein
MYSLYAWATAFQEAKADAQHPRSDGLDLRLVQQMQISSVKLHCPIFSLLHAHHMPVQHGAALQTQPMPAPEDGGSSQHACFNIVQLFQASWALRVPNLYDNACVARQHPALL